MPLGRPQPRGHKETGGSSLRARLAPPDEKRGGQPRRELVNEDEAAARPHHPGAFQQTGRLIRPVVERSGTYHEIEGVLGVGQVLGSRTGPSRYIGECSPARALPIPTSAVLRPGGSGQGAADTLAALPLPHLSPQVSEPVPRLILRGYPERSGTTLVRAIASVPANVSTMPATATAQAPFLGLSPRKAMPTTIDCDAVVEAPTMLAWLRCSAMVKSRRPTSP